MVQNVNKEFIKSHGHQKQKRNRKMQKLTRNRYYKSDNSVFII